MGQVSNLGNELPQTNTRDPGKKLSRKNLVNILFIFTIHIRDIDNLHSDDPCVLIVFSIQRLCSVYRFYVRQYGDHNGD